MNNDFLKDFKFFQYHRSVTGYTDKRAGCDTHYFALMCKGTAKIVSDRTELTLNAGDIFYIPKHCRYESYWFGSPDISFISLGFADFPEIGDDYLPLQKLKADDEILTLFHAIPLNRPAGFAAVGSFYLLISHLLPQMKRSLRGTKFMLVEKANHYISEHPTAVFREVAAHCAISESSLYAAYKEVTGGTPVQARHRLLAEKAAILLTTSDMPIEMISDVLGFSSPSYFRKIFKEQYRATPRDIRSRRSI